jgi:signal peptidase I
VREGKRDAGILHFEPKAVVKQNDADLPDPEHALKCELAAQVLRSFGTLRLEVTGLSMLPSVWPGDILFIERRDMEQIAAGEIVLFARRGKLVAHRLLYKTADGDKLQVITRGDGLLSADEPVSPTELLGSVLHILRAGEYVETGLELRFWARATSKLVRSFGWVARLLAAVHRVQGDAWRREALCKS